MAPSKSSGGAPPNPYLQNSNRYWRQAKQLLEKGELEKASELAWGSVVERIKALALHRPSILLRSHKQVREYIIGVANQIGDRKLTESYRKAESMHTNFYGSHLNREDVTDAFLTIEGLLMKINSLIESE